MAKYHFSILYKDYYINFGSRRATMWEAVFADVGVALIAILNTKDTEIDKIARKMDEQILLNKLAFRGIKPTAIRILILHEMLFSNEALSLTDLESRLDTVDRSTIFRTVTLFLSHHLVHGVDDGSGALKYAVCDNSCNCSVEDLHTHFYCEACHKTFCLKQIHVPVVALPPGFVLQGVNYVLKGLCDECSQNSTIDGRVPSLNCK